jgi:hypothetical protein
VAKIWRVYDGREPTVGGPWIEMSAKDAFYTLEISNHDLVSPIDKTPKFGQSSIDQWFKGYKHVVVEVEVPESRSASIEPGFYRSHLTPKQAVSRLLQQAMEIELGKSNVWQVVYKHSIDSQGRDAIKVNATISPTAAKKLKTGAALRTFQQVQKRLSDMGDERTPIISYHTKTTNTQNVGR